MTLESWKTILCMVLAAAKETPEALIASVTIHGALREMMSIGRTERHVDLAALVGQRGPY